MPRRRLHSTFYFKVMSRYLNQPHSENQGILARRRWRLAKSRHSISSLLIPFSFTKTMFSSLDSVGFNSYRSRFQPLPSSGMASPTRLLLPPGVERLQWKTTKIMMTAITTTAPHVTPIINGRLDDLLDPSSLFPPV